MIKLILICACLLGVVANAFGQKVSGMVTDRDGAAIAGATINVGKTKSTRRKAVTSQNGEFTLTGIETRKVLLSVSANGFEDSTLAINLDENQFINIVLEPKNIAATVSVTTSYLAGSPEAIERIAGSIQTIGKEELENARVFNFAEALRKVPGVSVRNEEGFGLRPNISIRGTNPTRSRKVLILEDGIPLSYAPYGDNSSYYHPPIERFESVEVLKGSGQIEYGPVTVAGVVNYLTPNPTTESKYSLKVIGGNRDYLNASTGYSGTFGETGVLANFTRKQGEGSRESLRAGVNDFNAKVIQPINASNILIFRYSHFDESSQLTYSGLTEAEFAANPRQNIFVNDDLEFFREGFSVSHTGVFSASSSVTTNFYNTYFSRDWWRQSSNSAQRPNRLNADPDCLSIADLNSTCGNQGTPRDFRTTGVEPRFQMQFKTGPVRNDFSAGFRLHYETQNRRKWNGFTPNSREEGSELIENNLRNALAISTFVQNRFIWNDFSFTPGIRIEKVNYERSNLLNGTRAGTEITQIIPGVGVSYNVLDNTTIFAGAHRGFSPPSTSDILTNNGGVVDLKSELSWNYEIGVRTRFIDGISIEATYFRNDFENQIVPASVAGGIGATRTNGGETMHEGMELFSRIDTAPMFKTDYNFYFQTAYTNVSTAEFRSERFSNVPEIGKISVSGNRLPYTPKHLATTSIGFAYRGFDGFVENVIVSSQFSDEINSLKPNASGQSGLIGGQIYFNTTVNYRMERWKTTIFATVKNVFDRLYIVDRTRGIYPSSPRLLQTGFKIEF